MKTYIIYVDNTEVDLIKAGSKKSAEKKGTTKLDRGEYNDKFGKSVNSDDVFVDAVYTEV